MDHFPVRLSCFYNSLVLNGILKGEEWKYATSIYQNGEWFAHSYNDAEWGSYRTGSSICFQSAGFYYRKEFNVTKPFTAYEFRIFFRGTITIYLNDQILVMNEESSILERSNSVGLSLVRPGDELVMGSNLLSVYIRFKKDETPLFDSYLALYLSSSDDCYLYSYPVDAFYTQVSVNASNILDMNESTHIQLNPSEMIRMDFGAFRPALSEMSVYVTYRNQFTADLLLVTTQDDVVLSRPHFAYPEHKRYFSFPLKTASYNSITLQFSFTTILIIPEIRLAVCRNTVKEVALFEKEEYFVYHTFPSSVIHPAVSTVGECYTNSILPSGISIGTHCDILGSSNATGVYPIQLLNDNGIPVGKVELVVKACSDRIVRYIRNYGSDSASEMFRVVDEKGNVVLQVDGRNKENTKSFISFCVPRGINRVIVDDFAKDRWAENSYVQFGEFFFERYVFYMRIRYEKPLNLPNEWILDLRETVPLHSKWYVFKKSVIPSNWYDSSVIGWNVETGGSIPVTEAQFLLCKKRIDINDSANVIDIVMAYQAGCIVYFNNKEIYRDSIPSDQFIINSTLASNSMQKVTTHRIRYPVEVHASNWLAIGIIHTKAEPFLSQFDAMVRLSFDSTSFRMENTKNLYTSDSGKSPGDLYTLDSWKRFVWETKWGQTKHTFNITDVNCGFWSCVQLHTYMTSFSRRDTLMSGPSGVIIQGKHSKEQHYRLLFNSSEVYWPIENAVNTFCFNPRIYDQDFAVYMDSKADRWRAYSLQFFSVIFPSITTIEYETTVLYTGVEYTCIHPLTTYLHQYESTTLPPGIKIHSLSGCLYGSVTSDRNAQFSVSIVAYTIDMKQVTSHLVFTVNICSAESLYSLSMYSFSSSYQTVTWTVQPENHLTFISGAFFLSSQSYTRIPICLGNGDNTITLQYAESVDAEVGVTLISENYLFFTAFLSTHASPFGFQVNTELLIGLSVRWRVLVDTSLPENWYKKTFDDSLWVSSTIADIQSVNRFVLLRKRISLPRYRDYAGLSFVLNYNGGVVLYLNGNLHARYNLDLPITNVSLPITPFASTQKAVVSVNLVDSNITDTLQISILSYCPVSNIPMVLRVVAKPIIKEESLESSMLITMSHSEVFSKNDNGIQDYYSVNMLSFPEVRFDWEFQNMEDTPFNTLFLQTSTIDHLLITISCINNYRGESIIILKRYELTHENYQSSHIPISLGLLYCDKYTVILNSDYVERPLFRIYQMYFYYDLSYDDSFCSNNGLYHAVKENDLSAVPCSHSQRNYAYVRCLNQRFSSLSTDLCYSDLPSNLAYILPKKPLAINSILPDIVPSFDGEVLRFFTYESLPAGVFLNSTTGALAGSITESSPGFRTLRIFGENKQHLVSTTIRLSYTHYTCEDDGYWQSNLTYSHTLSFSCGMKGKGLGVITRRCRIDYQSAIWEEVIGSCISLNLAFTYIFSAFMAVVLIPYCIHFCVHPKKKASRQSVCCV